QTNGTYLMGKNNTPGLTVDKVCKLLKSAQPLVWSVAIVFGLLGVSWIVQHFWKKKLVQNKERTVLEGKTWPYT
ncbi:MAG: hypothetical protein WBQ56_11280, partial [Candidatus Sulfotelmatobacter sp.]